MARQPRCSEPAGSWAASGRVLRPGDAAAVLLSGRIFQTFFQKKEREEKEERFPSAGSCGGRGPGGLEDRINPPTYLFVKDM